MMEQRRKTRERTCLFGEITTLSGTIIGCSVRDLSEGGARLSFGDPVRIPDRFKLSVAGRGLTAQAEVRWRRGNSVGVEFRSLRLRRSLTLPERGAA